MPAAGMETNTTPLGAATVRESVATFYPKELRVASIPLRLRVEDPLREVDAP
jgi:hypothetical protein